MERKRERSRVDLQRCRKCARDHKHNQSNVSQLSLCFYLKSPNFNCVTRTITFNFRSKLSEKMFLACQALKMHLSDNAALSSKELVS